VKYSPERKEAVLQRYELLTPREPDIIWRLVDGQANKAVVLKLDISERTVEQHRARAMRKMDARAHSSCR
jgi:FixJ family two-component response regulator